MGEGNFVNKKNTKMFFFSFIANGTFFGAAEKKKCPPALSKSGRCCHFPRSMHRPCRVPIRRRHVVPLVPPPSSPLPIASVGSSRPPHTRRGPATALSRRSAVAVVAGPAAGRPYPLAVPPWCPAAFAGRPVVAVAAQTRFG